MVTIEGIIIDIEFIGIPLWTTNFTPPTEDYNEIDHE